ncbi:amidohydrolase, PncC family [Cupriavidus sp. OV038]|jgi:PncC family amidohydrolase|uniref:CinA family protein n=1 Tax=unclassified Cupriavidus TaxID=2640874 RepID=UPI0008DF3407|nr:MULTISPECIES: CinA family protein [unclassified Cupriavidus]SFB87973.1 amidohydrolase, PncC family [Cupriavidus sp. OV038]SFP01893.1 amidohydrolase, PncC family [Cupriavidus sp. OV096]
MKESPEIRDTAHFLARHGLRLATAESCTAGLIASRIAEVPGCGDVLRCAVVAYAPDIKTSVLGVPEEVIRRHGLTSEAVSLAMAHGVLRLADANLAIANTGVADGNAPDDTPAGTQCFAWVLRMPGRTAPLAVFTETRRFDGDRNTVRFAAADYALLRIPHYYELARGGTGQTRPSPTP